MANKKISKRQEKKMKKLQEKRIKEMEKERILGISKKDREFKKRTRKAMFDIDRMTSYDDIELMTKMAGSMYSEISDVPRILSKNAENKKEINKLSEKSMRKDKTYNGTMTRVYYSAREKVRVSSGKYIAFIFLFIAFFTTYFTSNTLSRYAGTTQGNGSMQVARWNVEIGERLDPKTLDIISGNSASYVLEVKSASEVSNSYNIVLSNVPDDVQVQLDSGTLETPSNGIVTFEDAGSFNANSSNLSRNHIITFVTTLDTAAIDNNEIGIEVEFIQEEI